MGIPKFVGGWLRFQPFYLEVVSQDIPTDVGYLPVDMNSYIYKASNLVYLLNKENLDMRDPGIRQRLEMLKNVTPEQLQVLELAHFEAIGNDLLNLVVMVTEGEQENNQDRFAQKTQTRNLRTFILAIDGVAPQAKMTQQRQRRFKGAKEDKGEDRFNRASITPGTDFMRRLDQYLRSWIEQNRGALGERVVYSSHMSPGEGEHKIMDYLRDGSLFDLEDETRGSVLLHGMDTDLIMLSLLSEVPNIYLWREDFNMVLNIDSLRENINQMMGSEHGYRDFVLLMFFIGNDFLPSQPSVDDFMPYEGKREWEKKNISDPEDMKYEGSINILIRAYQKTGLLLTTDDGEIHWDNYLTYLQELAQEEERMIRHEARRVFVYPSKIFEDSFVITQIIQQPKLGEMSSRVSRTKKFVFEKFRNTWYSNALGPRGNSPITELIEKSVSSNPFEVTTNELSIMIGQYLVGVAWIYRYYNHGTKKINSQWYYPYYNTPLYSDLRDGLSDILESKKSIIGYQENNDPYPTAVHQLLTVIPPRYIDLIPFEVQPLMGPDSPIADVYPLDFVMDRSGVNQDYRATVYIPFVDPDRVYMAIQQYASFTPERSALFSDQEDLFSVLTKEEIVSVCVKQGVDNLIEARKRIKQKKEEKRQKERNRGRGRRGRGGRGRDERGGRGRGRGGGGRGGRDERGRGERERGERGMRGGRGRGGNQIQEFAGRPPMDSGMPMVPFSSSGVVIPGIPTVPIGKQVGPPSLMDQSFGSQQAPMLGQRRRGRRGGSRGTQSGISIPRQGDVRNLGDSRYPSLRNNRGRRKPGFPGSRGRGREFSGRGREFSGRGREFSGRGRGFSGRGRDTSTSSSRPTFGALPPPPGLYQ